MMKQSSVTKPEDDAAFRDLFDEAPFAYVLETPDSKFVRANRAAMQSLGLKPGEVKVNEQVQTTAKAGRTAGVSRCPLVLYVTDFHREEALEGIVEYARKAGWKLDASMRFHGGLPPESEADGIVASVSGLAGERVRNWLAAWKGGPIVRILGTRFKLPYPAVEADYAAAGRVGARHLLELGHIHYAFHSMLAAPNVRDARGGFEAELRAAGRRAHRLDFEAAHPACKSARSIPFEERSAWLAGGLKRLPKPIAIMSNDDRHGLDLPEACELAGLRVPEDVAFLGCDNSSVEQELSKTPLSSVNMNFERVGWEAAALLDHLMHGEAPPSSVIKVPPRGVVARQSTATFVTDSPGITAAVVYLREQFHKPVRLTELAQRAGMSKRRFEAEFKRQVGRPPRDELRRVRLACVARLLRDTDFKLDAIAVESGFGSASHLCRAFVGAYGLSPGVWRDKARYSS